MAAVGGELLAAACELLLAHGCSSECMAGVAMPQLEWATAIVDLDVANTAGETAAGNAVAWGQAPRGRQRPPRGCGVQAVCVGWLVVTLARHMHRQE